MGILQNGYWLAAQTEKDANNVGFVVGVLCHKPERFMPCIKAFAPSASLLKRRVLSRVAQRTGPFA
jgi:hypothetical protein